MDQMTADVLQSTEHDPTRASLDAAFDGITRVRLVGYRILDDSLSTTCCGWTSPTPRVLRNSLPRFGSDPARFADWLLGPGIAEARD
jgi:hypothetical protein